MTEIFSLSKIRSMTPVGRYFHWIKERENIRVCKEAGMLKPWTMDDILRSYRFCNVRRMDDKVSKWLYDNWYTPFYNHPNMLLAVAVARFVNKPESLELLTDNLFTVVKKGIAPKPKWDHLIQTLRKYRDEGNVIFNGAYMVRGNDGIDKIECVMNWYVKPLEEVVLDTSSMRLSHQAIQASYGMGSFMAGQVVADLRWAVDGTWEDKYVWAPLGPGSKRGMNRLEQKDLNQTVSQIQFETFLKKLIQLCKVKLPSAITKRLEAHDYQNTLCEFDKYERALWEQGKPKQKYSGE